MSEQEQKSQLTSPSEGEQKNGFHTEAKTNPASVLSDIVNPKQYFGVVLQYWWLILLVVLVGVGAGAAYTVFATPLYRASCRFELFREPRLELGNSNERGRRGETSVEQELNRQMIIMQSGTLHERVMQSLESEWNDEISSNNLYPKIEVKRVRDSGTMVDIHVDAVDREYASEYLDEMLDAYKQLRREEILKSNDQTLGNLREEQEDIERELKAARNALAEFRKEHNITYTQAKSWYDEQFLNNLIQRENSLRMEKTMLESRFDFLDEADASTIQAALDLTVETQAATENIASPEGVDFSNIENQNSSIENLDNLSEEGGSRDVEERASDLDRTKWSDQTDWQEKQARLLRLESEYDDQLETYRSQHPRMIELKNEIESAERDLRLAGHVSLKRLEARHEAVQIELDAVREAAETWRKALDLTTEERAEYSQLQSQVEHLKDVYNRIHKRIMDSSVVNADAMFSRIIEPIRAGSEPVWPAKTKIIILAVIASIGIGTGGAFTLEYFDTRFLDVMAIEERLNIPYISGVPNWRRVVRDFDPRKSSLVVSHEENDTSTETYRALRTGLEYLTEDYSSYALLLTSGEEGEGKSMTALNLAILFALSGKKVLLVDGDLRRGVCHKEFSIKREPGLCEFFGGEYSEWHNLIQQTGHDGLDFISSGQYRAEVPEMLSMNRARTLIREWKQEYDLVLIDSAPAGRIADTTIFARAADGVLLVVKHGSASFASVRHAVHRLLDANIVGFCLNNIELGQSKYSYYRKYGGYHYGRYAYTYGSYYSNYSSDSEKSTDSEV